MSQFDLIPCPYCGCESIWAIEYMRKLDGVLHFAVRCPACRMQGPEKNTKTEAIVAWNLLKKQEQEVLQGWKEIEDYLGLSRKTIRARGYPVQKTNTGIVFAKKEELNPMIP